MNGAITSHTHDYAASGHTHTNVQPVSMTGDILQWALDSAPMGMTPIYTGSSATNIPSSAYTYSNGYVLKRTSNETTVVLYGYSDTTMAVNHYVNSAWKGWSIAATQEYVDDAVSNVTASGGSYTPVFCKYKGSASSATASSGTATTVTMATRSFASNTSKFSISSGGIKCVTAGTIRVSGEVKFLIPSGSHNAGTVEASIYCGSDKMFSSSMYFPANSGATGTQVTLAVPGGLCKFTANEVFYLKITSGFSTTYYPASSSISIDYVS